MNDQEKLVLIKVLNNALATVHNCMRKEELAKRGFKPFPYVRITDRKELLRYLGEVE